MIFLFCFFILFSLLSFNSFFFFPAAYWHCGSLFPDQAEVVREKVQDGLSGEMKEISYTQCKIVGNGSFGVVFQTRMMPSGEDAAIKRVLQDKRFKVCHRGLLSEDYHRWYLSQNRELQIMRIVRHPNIVELKAFYYSNGERVCQPTYLDPHAPLGWCWRKENRKTKCTWTLSSNLFQKPFTGHRGILTSWRLPCRCWRLSYTSTSSSAPWHTFTRKASVTVTSNLKIFFLTRTAASWNFATLGLLRSSWRMSPMFPTFAPVTTVRPSWSSAQLTTRPKSVISLPS